MVKYSFRVSMKIFRKWSKSLWTFANFTNINWYLKSKANFFIWFIKNKLHKISRGFPEKVFLRKVRIHFTPKWIELGHNDTSLTYKSHPTLALITTGLIKTVDMNPPIFWGAQRRRLKRTGVNIPSKQFLSAHLLFLIWPNGNA